MVIIVPEIMGPKSQKPGPKSRKTAAAAAADPTQAAGPSTASRSRRRTVASTTGRSGGDAAGDHEVVEIGDSPAEVSG